MDLEVELAWQQEIEKRIAGAGRGKTSFMSWEDATKRLKGKIYDHFGFVLKSIFAIKGTS